jgi:hypothetical protein
MSFIGPYDTDQNQQKLLFYRTISRAYKKRMTALEFKGQIWKQYPDDPVKFIMEVLHQLRERSWWGWRVIIKAAFALPLDDDELAFFFKVAQRDPPHMPVRELWLIVGRRGGKDSVASMLAVERARFADSIKLRPGERSLIACLSVDRDQAGIVFNYTRGYFNEVPELKPWIIGDLPSSYRAGGIRLTNKTDIRVTTNNFRAPRGYPIPVAIFDEVAFWRSEDSANPDIETLRAIRPGMSRFPNPLLIGISTPYRKKGLLYQRYNNHFGQDKDRVLVIQAETRLLNPDISQEDIDADYEDDPASAKAEWGALFRDDLEDYVPPEVIRACTVKDCFELPYVFPGHYFAFVDPSGGSRDSFAMAIAHRGDNEKGVLDLIVEAPAPFAPSEIVREFANILRRYNISDVVGDNYAGEWPKEAFEKEGILYETSELNKSAIYKEALPLYRSQQVVLLDNRRFFNQVTSLERRTARGGRDSIDHPPEQLDDVANAVSGALVGVCLGWSSLDTWKRLAS